MSQPRRELDDTFLYPGVARAYVCRPSYPTEAVDLLGALIVGTLRRCWTPGLVAGPWPGPWLNGPSTFTP